MARGMMFRDSLRAGSRYAVRARQSPGRYTYWMYQVKIPLDIIWMDPNRRVVEISANTASVPLESARECPSFGGHDNGQLRAGTRGRHGGEIRRRRRLGLNF